MLTLLKSNFLLTGVLFVVMPNYFCSKLVNYNKLLHFESISVMAGYNLIK